MDYSTAVRKVPARRSPAKRAQARARFAGVARRATIRFKSREPTRIILGSGFINCEFQEGGPQGDEEGEEGDGDDDEPLGAARARFAGSGSGRGARRVVWVDPDTDFAEAVWRAGVPMPRGASGAVLVSSGL